MTTRWWQHISAFLAIFFVSCVRYLEAGQSQKRHSDKQDRDPYIFAVWSETSRLPEDGVAVIGSSSECSPPQDTQLTTLRAWVENGGRSLVLLRGQSAGAVLTAFGLSEAGEPAANEVYVQLAPIADENLRKTITGLPKAIFASPGGFMVGQSTNVSLGPLFVRSSGNATGAVRLVELLIGKGCVLATDLPLQQSEEGKLLIAELIRYLRESYTVQRARADTQSLVELARTRVEEAISLVQTKANSVSPNEMNSPKGDPWYRVPGSSGDRLIITPELEARTNELREHLRALRRNARKMDAQEQLDDINKLKALQREASQLAEEAVNFFNVITKM